MSNNRSVKSYSVTLVLVLLFGFVGGHRFYAGKVGTGLLFLFTAGFFVIGWIIDIFTVAFGNFTDKTGRFIRPKRDQSKKENIMTEEKEAVSDNVSSESGVDPSSAKRKVPTWVWIVGGILVLGLILQSCGGNDTAIDETSDAETTETEIVEEEVTVSEPEEEEAVEAEPDEIVFTLEDARTILMPLTFDQSRSQIIEIVSDMRVIESVDLFTYDSDTGLVELDVTPAFDFDSGVRDDAWELFRIFAGAFYKAPDNAGWLLEDPRFAPDFKVTVSTATYLCDGETMRDLANAMLSRSAWESTCKVR